MIEKCALESRHYRWLALPANLAYLRITAENYVTYAHLIEPSDELAERILLEVVIRHAKQFAGEQYAPRLIIETGIKS